MSNIKESWTEDQLELCDPKHFECSVNYDQEVWDMLSKEDRIRLGWKLELVEVLAKRLAANMLKGCLKYTPASDDMTPEQWIDYLADDAADALNYAFLLKRSLEKRNA